LNAPKGYRVENHVPPETPPNPPETVELIVSPADGIGPVKFGANVADIVRLLGKPDWQNDLETDLSTIPGVPLGKKPSVSRAIELNYGRRGFQLMANERGLYAINCGGANQNAFRGRTKEGIKLGASWDDVLKTYGKPEAEFESRHLWYRKIGYQFMFHDKKLASINVMRPVTNIEIEVRGHQIIERVVSPKEIPATKKGSRN
jgi:hypothetical protein